MPVMDQLIPVMDQFSNVNNISKKTDQNSQKFALRVISRVQIFKLTSLKSDFDERL